MINSKELQHEIEQKCLSFFQEHLETMKTNERFQSIFITGINQVIRDIVAGRIAMVIVWKDSIHPFMLIENFPLLCMVYNVILCPLDLTESCMDQLAKILKLKRLSVLGFIRDQTLSLDLIEFISDHVHSSSSSILRPLQTYMDYPKRKKI